MHLLTKLSLFGTATSSFLGNLAAPANKLDRRADAQIIRKCTVPNTAALTFDDGPYGYIRNISKALTDAGGKGTFFFNGNNYGCIYDPKSVEGVKYAYEQGHQIASHTWAHKDLSTLTRDQVHDEMWRVEQALNRTIGVIPAYMRPPYGNYNDIVKNIASERGQKIALWDLDNQDSLPDRTVVRSKKNYDEAIARHPPNILALNHEVHQSTAYEVVPYAIKQLKDAGYKLVTLAECLGEEPYQTVGTPSKRDDSWVC